MKRRIRNTAEVKRIYLRTLKMETETAVPEQMIRQRETAQERPETEADQMEIQEIQGLVQAIPEAAWEIRTVLPKRKQVLPHRSQRHRKKRIQARIFRNTARM